MTEIPPPLSKFRAVSRAQLAAALLLSAGLAAVVAMLSVDAVMGQSNDFGLMQTTILVAGLLLLLAAVSLHLVARTAHFPAFNQVVTVDWAATARIAGLTVQLLGLVLVARAFELESPAFFNKVLTITVIGFVIHHLLPLQARLSFFVLLSWTGIWWVFGWLAGTWLIAIGIFLILLCHLPIAFRHRVVLLLSSAVGLALLRGGAAEAPWPGAIWPILGSMFMFRLIAYMYDLHHSKEKPGAVRAAAYFFLLPNIVFPLFPVVDFATFRRTYYDKDSVRIYQRGVRWMLVGMVHLLLYRLVYQKLSIPTTEVRDLATLGRYMIANFGLYLRVSGQFHLIIGMLHLFGFRLPETHRFYFLASSFTDFWRRINIYWKDFMTKVFYYPVYFRVRRFGDTAALVIATLVVFFVTWATHSYQWFWLLGNVLLSTTDSLFWGILAALLVVNSIREARRGRARSLGVAQRSWSVSLGLSTRIVATFTTICVLWSLWTSATLAEWLAMLADARPSAAEWLVLGLIAGGAIIIMAAADQMILRRGIPVRSIEAPTFGRQFALASAVIVLLWGAAVTPTTRALGTWLPTAGRTLADLRTNELNRQDATLLQRGYYENLTGVNRFNSQLWEVYASRPTPRNGEGGEDAGFMRNTGDVRIRELMPNIATVVHGAPFTTNRWGMRDRDYELLPAASTHRIALLGQSYVMGFGVGDSETFESLVERQLNSTSRGGSHHRSFEILNFGVGGYTPAQLLWLLDNKVLAFRPNVAVYIAYAEDARQAIAYLATLVRHRHEFPYPFLGDLARRADLRPEMTSDAIMRRLRPYRYELLASIYGEFARRCREAGVTPVWFYLTPPDFSPEEANVAKLQELAQASGFEVFDFSNVYAGYDSQLLRVAAWDRHPNAVGHRLIADRLYALLTDRADLLGEPKDAATSDKP